MNNLAIGFVLCRILCLMILSPADVDAGCKHSSSRLLVVNDQVTSFVKEDNIFVRSWSCNREKIRVREAIATAKMDAASCISNLLYSCPNDALIRRMCLADICQIDGGDEKSDGNVAKNEVETKVEVKNEINETDDTMIYLVCAIALLGVIGSVMYARRGKNKENQVPSAEGRGETGQGWESLVRTMRNSFRSPRTWMDSNHNDKIYPNMEMK